MSMFAYLNKKITIPNSKCLRSIAWNHDQGWLATGAENGLLKVLKLDHGPNSTKTTGGSTLSSNMTLEGHGKGVIIAAWNEKYRKLATADENGLILMFTLHRNSWFEELSTERESARVAAIAWSRDGARVLFVYKDGHVILGTVEGERVWSTDMRISVTHSTWSKDNRAFLLGHASGDVTVHDVMSNGAVLTKLRISCVEIGQTGNDGQVIPNPICSLLWHPGSIEHCGESVPSIAVVYESGRFQLMNTVQDDSPIVSDINMTAVCANWNPAGTVLAIVGVPATGDKHVHVHFFSCKGKLLRVLKIPGAHCGGLTWESNGLRIAVAIDACIFFANVRPAYHWGYFNGTIVYAFSKEVRQERCVMFWNAKTNQKNVKYVRQLTNIVSNEDLCTIVSKQDDNPHHRTHIVAINDAVASPVEVKQIDFDPHSVLMGASHVIVAGDEMLWIWQFRSPNHSSGVFDPLTLKAQRKECYDRYIHIDELISGSVSGANAVKRGETTDYIAAVCSQGDYLYVMRQSGILLIYSLHPTFALVARQSTGLRRCFTIAVNNTGSILAAIDHTSVLSLFRLHSGTFSIVQSVAEQIPEFERKDVWSIIFADDDPETFVTMEKAKMFIFRNLEPEEPVPCNVCIHNFTGLKVRGFALDEVLVDPEHPIKDHIVEFETKSLRDTRSLLKESGVKEAFEYVLKHPHSRLWSLIVEAALEKQDFIIAERAVVRCKDYPAIHFVKRVKNLDDPQKQRAEVAAYYQRFDEAERIYKEMDRKDLALELRARLGDWFRVVQLVQEGGGDDAIITRAWENIGDFYAERQKWNKASQYYVQCKHHEKLAKALFVLEDFRGLEKIVNQVEHDKNLLLRIAEMFLSVGLVEAAVAAFLKAGEPRKAVDSCIHLHQWDQAVVLAEKNNLPEVNTYLSKYASHLVESGKIAQAIELYKKANQNTEAARLLSRLGQQAAAQQQPLKAKKFFVLAALEVETQRKRHLLGGQSAAQLADQLLASDTASVGDKSLDNAWHGAEAYHYFMMCQQHLVNRNMDAALCIAVRLMEYDDVISTVDAYSLVALTSYFAKSFGMCSKAFTRLEALEVDNEMISGGGSGGNAGGGGSDDKSGKGNSNLNDTTSSALDQSKSGPAASTVNTAPDDLDFDLDIATTKFASAGARFSAGTGVSSALQLSGDGFASSSTVIASGKPRKFAELAVRIFTQNPPTDSAVDRTKCFKCGAHNKDWASSCAKCSVGFNACIVTGKAVMPTTGWQCRTCRHRALESEVRGFKNCPLCHAARQDNFS